tara:strand:- start:8738 stop:9970 length:1233 start_codon:yes stop_codon:yes gene_type:complete
MNYYEVLEIKKDSTENEIKKAYRKLALIHHPDKGGDEEQFKNITDAYNILSNPKTKQYYDINGNINSIKNIQEKAPLQSFNIYVTLEDIYNTKTLTIEIIKKKINYDSITTCTKCKGSGLIFNLYNLFNIPNQIKCNKCNGHKYDYTIIKESVKHDIIIPVGCLDKDKIILEEQGDEYPYGLSGDIEIVINVKPHKYFQRKGNDLFYKTSISLIDSLCGCELDFIHLDGRRIVVKSSPNDIIKQYDYTLKDKYYWEKYTNYYCKLDFVAKANIGNYDLVIKAIETGDLKDKNVTAFYIKKGITYFYTLDNYTLLLDNKKNSSKSILYIKKFNNNTLKCIENEGIIDKYNNNIKGNLFFEFNIIFPDSISDNLKEILLNSELGLYKSTSEYLNNNNSIIYNLTNKCPYTKY